MDNGGTSRRAIWRDVINRQLPYASLKRRNALFEWQLTHLRWPYFPRRRNSRYFVEAKLNWLAHYTLNRGCLWPTLFAFVAVGLAMVDAAWANLIIIAAIGDIGYSLASNFAYAMFTINTLSPQIAAAQWDLPRLTALTDNDILQANHATIQIQAWRSMMRDVTIRAFAGITGIMLLIYSLTRTQSTEFDSEQSLTKLLIVMLCIGLTGLILEPLWRMRTVTLIAMTVTTWINNYAMTIIVTLVAVLLFMIAEFIVVLALSWIAYTIATSVVFQYSVDTRAGELFANILFPLGAAFVVSGVYVFFKGLDTAIFWQLKRVAFRG